MAFDDDDLESDFPIRREESTQHAGYQLPGRGGGARSDFSDIDDIEPPDRGRGSDSEPFEPSPLSEPRRGPLDKVKGFMQGNPLVVIGIVLIFLLVLGYFVFFGGSDEEKTSDLSSDIIGTSQQNASSDSGVFDPNDPEGTVKDNRDGNQDTAVNAIRGYLYSYYIDRDSKKAFSYYSENSKATAEDIQKNIDNTIPGVKYNIAITPNGTNEYQAVLTLILEDGRSRDFHQTYAMSKEGGKYYIDSFVSPQ